ncbi:MAG: calcium/sodium antiporter [Allosphingosinicella sp.]|uniref:calcium/sodium antiporter n=1 Tax=Allosphingosinicella sp. TaxID=2823234 RepID=UPI003927D31A
MLMTMLALGAGLLLLIAGGELLVRGAVRIAEHMRLSPLLIGLTIVGMGTSMPELATSVQASLAGSPGIAIGNIVGSNIANLLLILGFAALISPLAVAKSTLWRDGGVGLAAVVLLLVAGLAVGLSRPVGLIFVLLLAGYVYYAYREEKQGHPHTAAYDKALAAEETDPAFIPHETASGGLLVPAVLFVVGLALIVGGGTLLVNGAIALAQAFGISDTVIGLTIVAVGTSLPELVTSAIAALKRQSDVALGNVLGSNIYNVFFIGGVTGLVSPTEIPPTILSFDLWLLISASAAVMVFAWTGGRLSRREGLVLLAAYGIYTALTAGWL